jgi:hypothetical protein
MIDTSSVKPEDDEWREISEESLIIDYSKVQEVIKMFR